MKIGSFESKPVTPAQAGERKPAQASGAAQAGEPAAELSAQVALSPAASLLANVADDPAFDVAKVERIAAEILERRYQIDAEAIADKLIVNAEELLGRKIS